MLRRQQETSETPHHMGAAVTYARRYALFVRHCFGRLPISVTRRRFARTPIWLIVSAIHFPERTLFTSLVRAKLGSDRPTTFVHVG
jgi:hypothetical protein